MRRILSLTWIFLLVLPVAMFCGCSDDDDDKEIEQKVESVLLDESEINLEIDETAQLTASIAPIGLDIDMVWKSLDEEVATVDNTGLVTGVGEGETNITVTVGNFSAQCIVNVSGGDNWGPKSEYELGQKFRGEIAGCESAGCDEWDFWVDAYSPYEVTFVKDVSKNVCQFKIKGFWGPQLEYQDNNPWKQKDEEVIYLDVLVTIDASDMDNPTMSAEENQDAFTFEGQAFQFRKMDKVPIQIDLTKNIMKFDYSIMGTEWAHDYDFHLTLDFNKEDE